MLGGLGLDIPDTVTERLRRLEAIAQQLGATPARPAAGPRLSHAAEGLQPHAWTKAVDGGGDVQQFEGVVEVGAFGSEGAQHGAVASGEVVSGDVRRSRGSDGGGGDAAAVLGIERQLVQPGVVMVWWVVRSMSRAGRGRSAAPRCRRGRGATSVRRAGCLRVGHEVLEVSSPVVGREEFVRGIEVSFVISATGHRGTTHGRPVSVGSSRSFGPPGPCPPRCAGWAVAARHEVRATPELACAGFQGRHDGSHDQRTYSGYGDDRCWFPAVLATRQPGVQGTRHAGYLPIGEPGERRASGATT